MPKNNTHIGSDKHSNRKLYPGKKLKTVVGIARQMQSGGILLALKKQ